MSRNALRSTSYAVLRLSVILFSSSNLLFFDVILFSAMKQFSTMPW